jgi:hypothetical protein
MRAWLLFSMLVTTVGAVVAGAALSGCGDDPGFSGLPYAYSIDATPDGVIEAESDASVNGH